ncbi:hypothetical protein HY637_01330 [Candidatus Woesearchaeota archaeon]|nr:hypothetical protein [Candidatus Woesearchaeota archaeon]
MREEKYLQLIASFLAALVMTIPFYTTSVYAGINKITVKGADGVEGLARPNDALDFAVEASSEITNITKDHLYLGTAIKFDKCTTPSNGAVACNLKYPSSGKQDFGAKPFQFAITLYKDASKKQIEDSKPGVVIIDSQPPTVQLSISKKTFSGAENIIVDYEVADSACSDALCAGKCSGIKIIEFLSSDGSFKQAIDPKTAECSVKDKLTLEAKKFKDGLNKLTVKATDKFGQASAEVSVEFTLDSTPPTIIAETLLITRRGIALSSYSPFSVPVEVFVDISANDLDPNSVTGDFTALNPSVKNAKGLCQLLDSETHRCKWAINLNPGTAGSAITGAAASDTASSQTETSSAETTAQTSATSQSSTSTKTSDSSKTSTETKTQSSTSTGSSRSITITAIDRTGNKATATISKSLALDDKGPVVQSITTGITKDGKVFAKPNGNDVTVTLTESTSLSASEVFLHAGDAKFPAVSCKKESNWVCKWQNIDFGSAEKVLLSIESDTIDLLNNPSPESKPLEIIVDGTPPVVTGISLTPVGSLSEIDKDLFKVEDKIAVEANITEEHDITAFADFSRFVLRTSKVAGACKRLEENKQQCTWLTDAITAGGTSTIKFTFTDPAGNEAISEKSLTVIELDTTENPDFWGNSVECSPTSIDRQLGTLINQRMYCRVKLEKKFERLETLVITPATLSSCKPSHPIIQSVESFNTERGSTEPFLKITLKKDAFSIGEAKLTCNFNIISRINNKITKNPETESAEISIKLYNFPLGQFDEGVQNRINGAKKEAKETLKVIGSLNKVMFYARKLCQIIGVIYNFVTIFSIITAIEKATADAAASSVIGAPAAPGLHAQATSTCLGQQTAEDEAGKAYTGAAKAGAGKKTENGILKFCKFVNCQWAPGIMGKYQEWISAQINKLPLGEVLAGKQKGFSSEQPMIGGTRTGLAGYMDPTNNLGTAFVFACVPGVISGLEKYRQIKCLYADCMENAVAQDGMSPQACEDLKNYAECKYLWGEVFALIPYTAVVDFFTGIIKDALSNPFSALGAGLALSVGAACKQECFTGPPASKVAFVTCEVIKLSSKVGEVLENVQGIYKEGFKIRQDYCSRLDLGEDEEEESEEETQQAQPRSGTSSGSASSSGSGTSSSSGSSGAT